MKLEYDHLDTITDSTGYKDFGEFYKTVEWENIADELLKGVVDNPGWLTDGSISQKITRH